MHRLLSDLPLPKSDLLNEGFKHSATLQIPMFVGIDGCVLMIFKSQKVTVLVRSIAAC